jgi:hypothetical protein
MDNISTLSYNSQSEFSLKINEYWIPFDEAYKQIRDGGYNLQLNDAALGLEFKEANTKLSGILLDSIKGAGDAFC